MRGKQFGLLVLALFIAGIIGSALPVYAPGVVSVFSKWGLESSRINITGTWYRNDVEFLTSAGAATFVTVDTGFGANELYDMDQHVLQASAVTFATIDTGQGSNELYDMDQNVLAASDVDFNQVDSTEYFLSSVNITDTFYNNVGASAFVGFDVNRDYQENYFYTDGTNEQTQLDAAVSYVSGLGLGSIYIDDGIYDVEDWTLTNIHNVNIYGSGSTILRLASPVAANENILYLNGCSDIVIKNIIFNGTSDQLGNIGNREYKQCGIIVRDSQRIHLNQIEIYKVRQNAVYFLHDTYDCWLTESYIHESNCGVLLYKSGFGVNNPSPNNIFIENNVFKEMDEHESVPKVAVYVSANSTLINIISNSMKTCSSQGVRIDGNTNDTLVSDNIIDSCGNGVYFTSNGARYVEIIGNTILNSTSEGIYLNDGSLTVVSDNDIRLSGTSGIRVVADTTIVNSNIVTLNGESGIQVTAVDCVVSNNEVYDNSQSSLGTYTGITISTGGHRALVSGNRVHDPGNAQIRGISVSSANYVQILGNYVYNHSDNGIYLQTAQDCVVKDNYVSNNGDHGVRIHNAGTIRTIVKDNKFFNNTNGPLTDLGTDTVLHTLTLTFVDGTTFLNAGGPWGWEIDLNTEYAIALGQMPSDTQKIIKWKIWAISLVNEADSMRLEIQGRGAADNDPYTTESVSILDKPSTTTNFGVNDVIHWTLIPSDDFDLDDYPSGYMLIIKVLHEAAGGDDSETDAVFTCIEIEYV